MSDRATAYPLSWPDGWPRIDTGRRETARFKTTLSSALHGLKREVDLMGGKRLVLSSNYTLGNENPRDPGVVAFFVWQEMNLAIPCDCWTRIEANVHAIELTIGAMRGMERWGAKNMIKAMFTGFKQLPEGKTWWDVLGVPSSAPAALVRDRYRALAKQYHPDVGGDAQMFAAVAEAFERSGFK